MPEEKPKKPRIVIDGRKAVENALANEKVLREIQKKKEKPREKDS